METTTANQFKMQEVQITSVAFRSYSPSGNSANPPTQRLESYPKRMVYEGREYTFVDSGIRYLVKKGQQLIKLFDVSDGHNQYRLRLDDSNHWMLVGMTASA